jgi:hypothetical protein
MGKAMNTFPTIKISTRELRAAAAVGAVGGVGGEIAASFRPGSSASCPRQKLAANATGAE